MFCQGQEHNKQGHTHVILRIILPVGGQKVAAAFSVEPDDVIGAVTKASAAGTCSAETTGLKYDEVPGLEAAVAAKMRMLFPPKPERQEPPDLRRANSI